mgnify:CR=1 FL=1
MPAASGRSSGQSGATVAASARGAETLERGGPVPDDPQAGLGAVMAFPPVKGVSVVKDGQTLRAWGRWPSPRT